MVKERKHQSLGPSTPLTTRLLVLLKTTPQNEDFSYKKSLKKRKWTTFQGFSSAYQKRNALSDFEIAHLFGRGLFWRVRDCWLLFIWGLKLEVWDAEPTLVNVSFSMCGVEAPTAELVCLASSPLAVLYSVQGSWSCKSPWDFLEEAEVGVLIPAFELLILRIAEQYLWNITKRQITVES